jgi:hypothetical protein
MHEICLDNLKVKPGLIFAGPGPGPRSGLAPITNLK